jgi:hypothetical protein
MPTPKRSISSRVAKQNPRPRKYATAAERQKALRERFPTLCVRVEQEQADFMKRIADEQGRTLQDVHLAFIKYANGRGNLWLTQGLKGFAPLPRFEETPKENPMKRKPTPAQIAARERFAAMARTGAFKKAKRNPAKKTVSQKISQLTREGYPQKQAVAIALSEERAGKVKRNPISGQEAGEFRMTVNGKSVTRFFAHDNDAWANSYGFNYRLLSNVVKVGSPVRFTKTRAIVAIDEAADGSPVTETWEIRDLKFYKTNPRASNPIILVSDKPKRVTRKSNPQAPSARSRGSIANPNYRYAVQAGKFFTPGQKTMSFVNVAGFPTKAQAQDYIDALLKTYPKGLTLRIMESKVE